MKLPFNLTPHLSGFAYCNVLGVTSWHPVALCCGANQIHSHRGPVGRTTVHMQRSWEKECPLPCRHPPKLMQSSKAKDLSVQVVRFSADPVTLLLNFLEVPCFHKGMPGLGQRILPHRKVGLRACLHTPWVIARRRFFTTASSTHEVSTQKGWCSLTPVATQSCGSTTSRYGPLLESEMCINSAWFCAALAPDAGSEEHRGPTRAPPQQLERKDQDAQRTCTMDACGARDTLGPPYKRKRK